MAKKPSKSHRVQAFALGVSTEQAAHHLLAALTRAGRQVISRRAMDPASPPTELRAGSLYWAVRQERDLKYRLLFVWEGGASSWDLVFLRALSEESDGIVIACDEDAPAGRHGQASFLGGRTLDVATSFPASSPLAIGGRSLDTIQNFHRQHRIHEERIYRLFNRRDSRELTLETILAEEWTVTPAVAPFSVEEEACATWMLLTLTSAEQWHAAGGLRPMPRGWRARALAGPQVKLPYIELRRDGTASLEEFLETTRRLDCLGLILEVPGRGEPYDWALASGAEQREIFPFDTTIEELGYVLDLASVEIVEPPAVVLGRGQEGWETEPGP